MIVLGSRCTHHQIFVRPKSFCAQNLDVYFFKKKDGLSDTKKVALARSIEDELLACAFVQAFMCAPVRAYMHASLCVHTHARSDAVNYVCMFACECLRTHECTHTCMRACLFDQGTACLPTTISLPALLSYLPPSKRCMAAPASATPPHPTSYPPPFPITSILLYYLPKYK